MPSANRFATEIVSNGNALWGFLGTLGSLHPTDLKVGSTRQREIGLREEIFFIGEVEERSFLS
jgi:hypothetical protein